MSDIKMTEIERIKKSIESAVTVFVGQDENEQGIILSKQSLFYLITTIESQQEKISNLEKDYREVKDELNIIVATENSLIESQKEEIENKRDLILTSNKMYTEISLRESDLNDEIDRLKAITELAVKEIELLKQSKADVEHNRRLLSEELQLAVKGLKEINYNKTGANVFQIADNTLSEIERLSHEHNS